MRGKGKLRSRPTGRRCEISLGPRVRSYMIASCHLWQEAIPLWLVQEWEITNSGDLPGAGPSPRNRLARCPVTRDLLDRWAAELR